MQNELPEKNIINLRNLSNEEQIKNQILPQLSNIIRSVMEDDKIKVRIFTINIVCIDIYSKLIIPQSHF